MAVVADDVGQQIVALLPRLRRFAYALTRSIDEGDDVVQAACERALRRLHQWEPGSRLDSWMFRIVQTIWLDRLRARKTRGDPVDPDQMDLMVGTDGRREMEARSTLKAVRKAMSRLSPEHLLVLVLISIDGLSYKEASTVLDVPIGTVMSRLARARKQLHEMVYGAGEETLLHRELEDAWHGKTE